MGAVAIGLIIKFILFKIVWVIGCILLFLNVNMGLPETFIKFWCGFVIAGFLILLPYCLIQILNPGIRLNRNRALFVTFALGTLFWMAGR
jgi:hypothetical protein